MLCALATSISPAAAQAPLQLQPLVNDAVAQLQLGYRHNLAEQQRRYDELSHVVEAWRAAPRTNANNRLLEDWLRGAIRNSMPGSRNALPPLPQFEQAAAIVAPHDALPHEIAPSDSDIEEVSNAAPTTSADGQHGDDAAVSLTDSSDALAPNLANTDPADTDPFVDDPVQAE